MIKNLMIKYREQINYLIFGVLTTIVALATYYLLSIFVLDVSNAFELQIDNVVSWVVGVLFAYYTNRKYVFNSKNENKMGELVKFTSGRVVTLFLDMFIMFLFVTVLHFNDKIFKLVSQVLVVIGNYIISKLFVFKK